MSEAKTWSVRLIMATLIVANLLFFAYTALTPDPRADASSRIEALQINPGRIKLIESATRGPAGPAANAKASKAAAYRACLEWSPIAAADANRAESALARLALPQSLLQRPLSDANGVRRFAYFVREPDAAVVAQIAELQRTFPGSEIKAGPCPT